MYCISEQQIDHILTDLSANGIGTEGLRYDLLDHICILIEQNLEEGGDFETYYASIVRTFYKQELREIEEQTKLLLTLKHRIVLSRNLFFLFLFVLFASPFIAYIFSWVIGTGPAAGWNIPIRIWGASLVFSTFPLLVILVLYLTPDRLDPVIPWNSRILIGLHPFIEIVPVHA